MSVGYRPVLWNANKVWYDLALGGFVAFYLILFLRYAPGLIEHPRIGGAELRMRAFGGSCVSDVDDHPMHRSARQARSPVSASAVQSAPFRSDDLLRGDGSYVGSTRMVRGLLATRPLGGDARRIRTQASLAFPFEWLGMAALAILFAMAATSHDFWLSFLSAPIWKRLHMLVYVCYALVVMHGPGRAAVRDEFSLSRS